MLPVLIVSPPHNTYYSTIASYRAAEIMLAMEFGITAYDPWFDYTDKTTGAWLAGASSDAAHPTLATQEGVTDKLLAFLAGSNPAPGVTPRCNTSGPSGCISGGNNLLLTDTNADGVADGWTLVGDATATIVAAPAGHIGKFQKLANAAGSYGEPHLKKTITSGFSSGDSLLLTFAYEAVAAPDTGLIHVGVVCGGLNYRPIDSIYYNVGAKRFSFKFSPTDLGSINIYFYVKGSGTGQYISFGEFEVYNLTTLLAA